MFFRHFRVRNYFFIQSLFIILFFSFLIGSVIIELNAITNDYNQSTSIIELSAFEKSGFNDNLNSDEFQSELDLLKDLLKDYEVNFIQYSEGLKFLDNFTWNPDLINIYPYNMYSKFLFMQNDSINSMLSLFEGKYPDSLNEITVNVRFKEKGYEINDNLTFQYYYDEENIFPYDGSQDSSHLDNITFQIVGFYEIDDIDFIKSIDSTSYNIKYQYILGSSSLGLNLYQKINPIMIDNAERVKPIQSKVVIFSNQSKNQKYYDIYHRSAIITNWFNNLSIKGYNFDIDIDLTEIGLNTEKLYVFNESIIYLKLHKTEISFILFPFLLVLAFIGKFCSDQLMLKNKTEFHKLHCLGYDFKRLKWEFPLHVSIRLLTGIIIFNFLLYEGLPLIPIIGEMLVDWVFSISTKLIICYIIFNFIVLYKTCYKFLINLVENEYPSLSSEEEKQQNYQKEINFRRKRKIFRRLLIYSIISILLFLLVDFSFSKSLILAGWFYSNSIFLFYFGLALIPLIIIVPYLVSNIITPYFSQILNRILKMSQKMIKDKFSLMNIYIKNVKKNQIYKNTAITILVICLTLISLSSVFLRIDYNFQSSKHQLTWDNFSYRVDLEATSSHEYDVLSLISSDIQKFPEIINSTEILFGPVRYSLPDFPPKQCHAAFIHPQSYLSNIDRQEIYFNNYVINKSKIFNQLDDGMIIISKIFADAWKLNVGDMVYFNDDAFLINAILESAPLLSIDTKPDIIHVIFSSKYNSIAITGILKIYLKTDESFNYNDYCNFLTIRYNYILNSISHAPKEFQYRANFLAKYILLESVLLVISYSFFQLIVFKEIQSFRRKDHEILHIHGINDSNIYKMLARELFGFLSIIIGISCILYFFLGFFIYDFVRFFINMQFEIPVYGGFNYFISETLWSRGLYLFAIGKPYSIPYHFFTLEVFILILFQIILLKIFIFYIKRRTSKRWSFNE